jgi:N-acyl-D-amino-acid deacylase
MLEVSMNVLLKNGTVMDGTGNAPYIGSIFIAGGVIRDILKGEINERLDCAEIDCAGKVIAPGFIDSHSHNDWFAALADPVPYFKTFAEQGITSQVTGNCGMSPFGYEAGSPHLALMGSGIFKLNKTAKDYSSFAAWQAEAEKRTPLNLIPLQGHGTIRLGLAGYENRPLSEDERAKRNAKIERSFDEGVFGLSFGLMYEPERYSSAAELEEAARLTAKRGGILTVHARAFSAASTSYSPPVGGEAHNIRALKEMIDLARRTGVKLQYSHLIFVGTSTWKTADKCLELIRKARAQGVDIMFDMYSMTFGVSVITVVLPSWYLSLPVEKRKRPLIRTRLALEIGITKRALGFDFSDMQIAWAGEGSEHICGKRVSEIAAEQNTSELDAYIKLVEMSGGTGRVNLYRYYSDALIEKLAKHEASLFMTDAWIEEKGVQNAAAYSCFPKFLALSRDKNVIPLEKAVRKMSGAVADRFGIPGRGYIKKGCAADVTVFDPAIVGEGSDPLARPKGVCHVFINGLHVVKNGAADDSLLKGAGRIITR